MKIIVTFLAVSTLLMGCASHSPDKIALGPEQPQVQVQTSQLTPLALTASDLRTVNYVVRYVDTKPQRLVGTFQDMRSVTEQLFRKGFASAGYQIDPASGTTLDMRLEQLQTDVENSMLGFEAITNLAISVQASNSSHTFSKRYSATSRLKGPFSADFATLELDINKLLTQLSGEIINDPELNQFLKQAK
ncbi:YajG family lipoprotein [Shewanella yunxiaonensis]|uniref:YajG family lipoprotein n=1 Tax=Shewanella yunxiaonensis TaxID=2829809 RepID=A0ABX7YQL7_9GAMM|nr:MULTISPECIES: YajG family lipoprotein [Shewanella]MDF0533821.1 YajG family lipoprotein [Shewanella sp. A32]QUN05012.1 YajG family lipoprotein [Shewanella yunxiaonensis]